MSAKTTFNYFRWNIPVETSSLTLHNLAEEISAEKRMPVEDVEQDLKERQLALAEQINANKPRNYGFVH